MKQIWLVTKREYFVEVKKKSFILLTFAMPFLMVGLMAVVIFLNLANSETNNIAIVDESGLFYNSFESNENNHYYFYPKEGLTSLKDTISDSKYLSGILVIPPSNETFNNLKKDIQFISNKNVGISLIPSLQNKIEDRLEALNLEKKGISAEDLEKAKVNINIDVKQEFDGEIKQTNQTKEGVKSILSGILMYATFMFIMIYGVRVMRNVIEEKNNRVVEIIISSVKPFNLMMGKILGTTLVAITQFAIWITTILILLLFFPHLMEMYINNPSGEAMGSAAEAMSFQSNIQEIITAIFEMNIPLIIGVFFIYFFFGYLFYSALFAAIGSSVESDAETQQFMWLGILPLSLGLYGSISIFENPDGPVGFWFSLIPFTSPVTMMARITFGVPTGELLLSIFLLLASVFLMVWFAAKIYRVGILMYGKKTSIKEWLKWIKY